MTAEDITTLLRAVPFTPFLVYVPDRPPFRVPHPDFASLSPTGNTLVIWSESGGGNYIDVRLITNLEPQSEQTA